MARGSTSGNGPAPAQEEQRAQPAPEKTAPVVKRQGARRPRPTTRKRTTAPRRRPSRRRCSARARSSTRRRRAPTASRAGWSSASPSAPTARCQRARWCRVEPALDAAAIAAVKTWVFKPSMRCGKADGGRRLHARAALRARRLIACVRSAFCARPRESLAAVPASTRRAGGAAGDEARRAGGEHVRSVTKAPKLVTFVEADIPPTRRRRASRPSVLLAIEIGADGKVENVTVLQSAGARLRRRGGGGGASSSSSSPAEVDNKPAPVKITYQLHLRHQDADGEARARRSTSRARPRALHQEAVAPASRSRWIKDTSADHHRRRRALRVHRRAARRAQGAALGAQAGHRRDRRGRWSRTRRRRSSTSSRRKRGGHRRGDGRARRRASRRSRCRRSSAPRRRAASPARRATP